MTEADIEASVVQWLRLAHPRVYVTKIPNEGIRSYAAAAHLRARGLTRGAPDLVMCLRGRYCALEIKTAGGRLGEAQLLARDAIVASGGRWALVRSLEDAQAAVAQWLTEIAAEGA